MKRHLFFILLALFSLAAPAAKAAIVINELMPSNVDCVMDDQNEFPDSWVELFNTGQSAVTLSNYALGTSRNFWEAYFLPTDTIPAGGHLLVWCDGGNSGRHTSWKIDSGKGSSIYLFRNSQLLDSVTDLPGQPAPNIAYGRTIDGGTAWGWQITPSPGSANCGQTADRVLGDPVFSVPGQVFETGQRVTLSVSLPEGCPAGTVVRYTLDGSEPTDSSNVLSGSLSFTGSRIIRARLFCPGWFSPRSVTQSYLMLGHSMTLPVISLSTDERFLSDSLIGIWTDGSGSRKNYEYNWRRPFNFEFFEASEQPSALNQLIEGRICGGASRGLALKSLALYAHKRFGHKRFHYEFFPDQRPGISDFKSIMLRNAGNDFDYLYMRDAVIQRSMARNADIDWQAWRPAVIFINGQYKGILNIRERSNEENIRTNYQGLEDICMMENNWDLKVGTWSEWNAFVAFREQHGHSWTEYCEQIDCIEYINYMLMQLFYNNQDFPGNNVVSWKPMQATDSLPARWRFLAKDTEYALGLYDSPADYNTMAWFYNPDYDSNRAWANGYDATRMFRRAMENDTFRCEFVDRAAIAIGDFLNYDRVWTDVWQPMFQAISSEWPYHRALYNRWWPNYNEELQKAQLWLQQRPAAFLSQLASQYQLGDTTRLCINTGLSPDEALLTGTSVNGMRLSRGQMNGAFWMSHTLTLSADNVSGWRVEAVTASGTPKATYTGTTLTLPIPDGCKRLIINAIPAASALEDFANSPFGEPSSASSASSSAQKIFRCGQLIILRDGHAYDALGRLLH